MLAVLAVLCTASTVLAADPEVSFIAAPDGVPLCVAEGGNPAGPPLVFIHGYSQTYAVFTRQFGSDLARDYRLLALDMRGHGCSGKPWSESAYASAKPWAGDIATLLEARSVTRPLLVGWSAGGYWIADYVREHGVAGLAGIVLAGSHGGLMSAAINPAVPEISRAMRAANQAYPPDIAQAMMRGEQFVPLMAASPLPEDVGRIMYAATLMLPAYARRAMATRSMDNSDLVPRFRVPVLFIQGEQDRGATPDQVRALAAQLPDARLSLYPDTGHSAFAEQPERFNRELAEFAARVRPGKQP